MNRNFSLNSISRNFSLIVITCLFLFACEKEKNSEIVIYNIASERFVSPLQDEGSIGTWFIAKQNQNEEWRLLTREIEGFVYESGYEYIIKVSIKPTEQFIDQDPVSYRLIKVISKEKKETNLPERFKK